MKVVIENVCTLSHFQFEDVNLETHILNCIEKPGRVVKIKYITGIDIFNRKGIKK